MGRSVDRIPCDCRSKSSHPNVVIEASLRRPKDHQNDPSWNLKSTSKSTRKSLHGICVECGWNMYGIRMEYVWNMHGIRMERVWNMHGLCMEYGLNMYGICMEYVWNMYGRCMECVWNLPILCSSLPV